MAIRENFGEIGKIRLERWALEDAHMIDQKKFIDAITLNCMTEDYEANGCNLDKIMNEFLESIKAYELIEAVNKVDCWRA